MSCVECRAPLDFIEGELVCPSCGVVAMAETRVESHVVSASALLTYGSLGSYIGSLNTGGTTNLLGGSPRSLADVKRRGDPIGRDVQLGELERLVQSVAEKLGLGHTATTEAVLVVRHTYARSRKVRALKPALSAHAILTALRRTGRADITARQVIEAHRLLGRRLLLRHLLEVEETFPLPASSKEDILTAGVRRLFGEGHDPRLIGSVLAESKALLASFGESSRNPRTVAGVAIYEAGKKAGARLTQKRVAEAVGVSEYTLREAAIFYHDEGSL